MNMRLIGFVLLLLPGPAAAEVSDKAASIGILVGQGIIFAVMVFFAARYRWWLGFAGLIFGLFLLAGTVALVFDQFVGQALLHEQGIPYFVAAFASDVAVLLSAIAGGIIGWRRRHAAQKSLGTDAPKEARR
jgi:hypothetical protein